MGTTLVDTCCSLPLGGPYLEEEDDWGFDSIPNEQVYESTRVYCNFIR